MINDELRELVLPHDVVSTIWGRESGEYHEGGIEGIVPFHYPALLATYTESVLFTPPRQDGLPLRQPALTKLKVPTSLTYITRDNPSSIVRLGILSRPWSRDRTATPGT